MKKIIKIALAALLLASSACSDFLELEPTNSKEADTYFESSTEAYQALIGIYEKLRSDYKNTIPNSIPILEASMSDDAYVGGDPSGNDMSWLQDLMRFKGATNSPASEQTWNKCYEGIQRVNTLLANYDDIFFKTTEEDIKNEYKGEATFLRAHFYFELLRLFENVVIVDKLLRGDEWQQYTQSSPEEVYAFAVKDIIDAIPLMSESLITKDADNSGRLTKYAAMAELIKMYMFYTGVYGVDELPHKDGKPITKQQVMDMAEEIINAGMYSLEEEYENLFNANGDYSKEVIFEIPFNNTGSGHWGDYSFGNMMCMMSGPRDHDSDLFAPGWGFFPISRDLEASFEKGDKRKSATIVYAKDLIDADGDTYGVNYNYTGMHSNKYSTHTWNRNPYEFELNWAQNYHYIRLADIILIAAELNVNTDNAKATSYVNQIRERAGLEPLSSVTLAEIQQERRVELALEGHRYFDLLRRGLEETAQELTVSSYELTAPSHNSASYVNDNGANMTGDIGDPNDFVITFDKSKRGFLPIPQIEIDLHPALIQNAGY
ncbi:RagB/SusD family nutrient uptake outer membrane protein [Sediminitomix flava]|uniref:Putative outer membrane starch-binding protein n=1 Tax=Sediminitomix flava TaxID=379075 RepID=A0A315ZBI9_SEDFL|nr:RagB/SusD family nutrient uptake outer membrane protein [Sediminitomix flava]PWJ42911.1 putative outer membrane starch-binding protein [Sediminitomix flava]